MEYEFKIFGVKDPDTDLKADPNFVVNYKINETHLDFRESYM